MPNTSSLPQNNLNTLLNNIDTNPKTYFVMDKITPVPSSVHVEENTKQLLISYSWYKWHAWFLIFFALIWNGFLVGWFLAPTPWFFKAFASIHAVVGIGLVWYILCLFFNKTQITLTKYDLTITHSPIPFPSYKNCTLTKQDIKQIYIKENISKNRNSGTSISYELYKLDTQNKSTKIMGSIDDVEVAVFIKQKVQQFFNITPQDVEGEYIA